MKTPWPGILVSLLAGIVLCRLHAMILQPRAASVALGMVDVGFLSEMAVHHDQAVTLGMMALQRGTPAIRAVSASIVGTQMEEIGRMRERLAFDGRPELPTGALAQWMLRDGDPEAVRFAALCGAGAMPGMVSVAELDELRSLSDEAFDVRFLQLMIRHHQGALPMTRLAARKAESASVRQLAARISYEQPQEVARMLQMLSGRGALPLSSPLGVPPIIVGGAAMPNDLASSVEGQAALRIKLH